VPLMLAEDCCALKHAGKLTRRNVNNSRTAQYTSLARDLKADGSFME
jgi:hypothetical protein